MDKVIECEKLMVGWTLCLLISLAYNLHWGFSAVLGAQLLVTTIATIINSYKHHGTKKRKTGRKARG